jgi:soluble lytic murein transglycosylase-like protein
MGSAVVGKASGRWRVAVLTLSAAVVGVVLAGVLNQAGAAKGASPLAPPHATWDRGDPAVAAIIRIECRNHGIPEEFALCVADHESRLDPQAIGDHGGAVGLYQFHLSTWQHFRMRMGLPADDLRLDARESARTACWAFANGFQQRWTVVRRVLCTPLGTP